MFFEDYFRNGGVFVVDEGIGGCISEETNIMRCHGVFVTMVLEELLGTA